MQQRIAAALVILLILCAAYGGSYWMVLHDSAVGAGSATSDAYYVVPVEEYHVFGHKTTCSTSSIGQRIKLTG
jgi:hypothetical protein